MLLRDALGVTRGEMVSLIGAGGKTTTLFRLAKELRDLGGKVMVTTTTKIFKPTKPHIDRLFIVEDVQALVDVCAEIAAPAIIGAGCAVDREGKLLGMPTPWLDRLNQDGAFDAILVEADGAASRLPKYPGGQRTGDTGELSRHRMDRRNQNTGQTSNRRMGASRGTGARPARLAGGSADQ